MKKAKQSKFKKHLLGTALVICGLLGFGLLWTFAWPLGVVFLLLAFWIEGKYDEKYHGGDIYK